MLIQRSASCLPLEVAETAVETAVGTGEGGRLRLSDPRILG